MAWHVGELAVKLAETSGRHRSSRGAAGDSGELGHVGQQGGLGLAVCAESCRHWGGRGQEQFGLHDPPRLRQAIEQFRPRRRCLRLIAEEGEEPPQAVEARVHLGLFQAPFQGAIDFGGGRGAALAAKQAEPGPDPAVAADKMRAIDFSRAGFSVTV